ncbi:MAG TPA: gliding motility-associated C-terminal domain-containing protein [Saprospiraceae bacterium]|nr:gliding motility-associated C-terminal domain-containing protein [Saprospiraceae bacterium]
MKNRWVISILNLLLFNTSFVLSCDNVYAGKSNISNNSNNKRAIWINPLTIINNSNIPTYLPQEGLVAWYPFDGNSLDMSDNNNDGIVNGSTLTEDRFKRDANAYYFRGFGHNDHIRIPNSESLQFDSIMTISLWYLAIPGNGMDGTGNRNVNATYALFAKQGDGIGTPGGFFADCNFMGDEHFVSFFMTNGCCDARFKTDSITHFPSNVSNELRWNHLVVIVHNQFHEIYINGVKRYKRNHTSNFEIANTLDLFVGIYGNGNSNQPSWYPFNGAIDDIGIWNRALSLDEIQQIYYEEEEPCLPLYVPTDDLISWYSFCGNYLDYSANEHHGSIIGQSLFVEDRNGRLNSACYLDGQSYVLVPHHEDFNAFPFSVSAWIKTSNASSGAHIVNKYRAAAWNGWSLNFSEESKGSGWYLRNGEDIVISEYGGPIFESKKPLTDDQWYMITFTVDEEGGSLYVNGILEDKVQWRGNFGNVTSSFPVRMGIYQSTTTDLDIYYIGIIDDIGIWSRVLSGEEILDMYNEVVRCERMENYADAGSNLTVCDGEVIALTASGGIEYSWSDGVIQDLPFQALESKLYTVTVTNEFGCTETDQVFVEIMPNPNVTLNDNMSICQGELVILSASGGDIYQWSDGIVNNEPFIPVQSNSYFVTVTFDNGCFSIDSVSIIVNPEPNVNAGPDIEICRGEEVILSAIGDGVFTWDKGVQQNVPFTPNESGFYRATVTNEAGCTNYDSLYIQISGLDSTFQFKTPLFLISLDEIINVDFIHINSIKDPTLRFRLKKFPSDILNLISFPENGTISLKAKDPFQEILEIVVEACDLCNQCLDLRTEVRYAPLAEIIKTNIITPLDSYNESLKLSEEPIDDSEIWIFNRWGQQVHYRKNYQNDWIAEGLPGGVYYYVFKVFGIELKSSVVVIK